MQMINVRAVLDKTLQLLTGSRELLKELNDPAECARGNQPDRSEATLDDPQPVERLPKDAD